MDKQEVQEHLDQKKVVIFTDGSCLNNPGPGGYGAVLMFGKHEKELYDGLQLTTNSRMEILAVVAALEALKKPCSVIIVSDSKYVVDAVQKRWVYKWKANRWRRNKKDWAENADLWMRVVELCDMHQVEFRWVKGHAGNFGNERCDELAKMGATGDDLKKDENYESGQTTNPLQT